MAEKAVTTSILPEESTSSYLPVQSEPPPYSSSTSHIPEPEPTLPRRAFSLGLPDLDFSQYRPKYFREETRWGQSSDGAIVSSYEGFSRDPEALKRLTRVQASLPPKPVIQITGLGFSGVDFDLKLNLMPYLIRQDQNWNHLEIAPAEESSTLKKKGRSIPVDELDDLVRRFCKDQVSSRQLVLHRLITNWDTDLLEGRIRSLISRLNYPGKLTIKFPLLHSKVTVQPPQKALAVLHNLFRSTKKYELKSVWPYADLPSEEPERRFAVMSEEEWWRDWKEAVEGAVLQGRKGWVSVEDRLECLMLPREGGGVWVPRGGV